MRSKATSRKRSPWPKASAVAWMLVSSSLSCGCLARLEKLRQRDSELSKTRNDRHTERTSSLSQLWENEALLAQTEADRVLFRWENVFNSLPTPKPKPTRAPITPTQPPSPRPTPAPFPATSRPTRQGGGTDPPLPTLSPINTVSPTPFDCLVGTTIEDFLLQQLSTITSATLLTNPSTPQGRAFQFMVNDPLQPDVCTYPTLNQRYAMATIYYSTNGANWADDTGWVSALNECSWRGVTCDGGTAVTRLELGTNKWINNGGNNLVLHRFSSINF